MLLTAAVHPSLPLGSKVDPVAVETNRTSSGRTFVIARSVDSGVHRRGRLRRVWRCRPRRPRQSLDRLDHPDSGALSGGARSPPGTPGEGEPSASATRASTGPPAPASSWSSRSPDTLDQHGSPVRRERRAPMNVIPVDGSLTSGEGRRGHRGVHRRWGPAGLRSHPAHRGQRAVLRRLVAGGHADRARRLRHPGRGSADTNSDIVERSPLTWPPRTAEPGHRLPPHRGHHLCRVRPRPGHLVPVVAPTWPPARPRSTTRVGHDAFLGDATSATRPTPTSTPSSAGHAGSPACPLAHPDDRRRPRPGGPARLGRSPSAASSPGRSTRSRPTSAALSSPPSMVSTPPTPRAASSSWSSRQRPVGGSSPWSP